MSLNHLLLDSLIDAKFNKVKTDTLNLINKGNDDITLPPTNTVNFFTDNNGILNSKNSVGDIAQYTTNSVSADYLPLDGSQAMEGDLNMGGNDISNIVNINLVSGEITGINTISTDTANTFLADNIITSSSNGISGNIITFINGKLVQDSLISLSSLATVASLNNYLKRDGTNTMIGTLNLNTNAISNVTTLNGINPTQITTNTTNIATNTTNIATNTTNITTLQTKTQNQSATSGNTNFTGILQQAGVNIATVTNLTNYVLKAGDTMSGTLNMGTNAISNVTTLNGTNVSDFATNTSVSATYMPKSGGMFTGPVQMGTQIFTVNNISDNGTTGMVWGSGSTASNISSLVIGRNSSATNDSCIFGRNSSSAGQYGVTYGINNSSANNTVGNTALGSFCNASGDTTPITGGGGAIAIGYTVTSSNKESISIGSGITNNTASSLLIGGTAAMVNWRTNNDNTCDLGVTGSKFKDIYANGSLITAASSKSIDNIVSTASTGTSGNIVTFSSGKIVQDSTVALSSLATTASLATYVQGPASAVTGNLCSYNSTTGKVIADSLILGSNVFLKTGTVAMTGALNLNSQNITNGGVITVINTTDSTTVGTGSIITSGGIGIAKEATIGGFIRITNTNSSTTSADGSFNTLGGISAAKNIIIGDTTSSISVTTGSFVTPGGIGVTKDSYFGGNINIGQNIGLKTTSFGSGVGCFGMLNASTLPSVNPTGGGVLYSDAGALKWRGSSGTVTTIANA